MSREIANTATAPKNAYCMLHQPQIAPERLKNPNDTENLHSEPKERQKARDGYDDRFHDCPLPAANFEVGDIPRIVKAQKLSSALKRYRTGTLRAPNAVVILIAKPRHISLFWYCAVGFIELITVEH